MPTFQRTSHLPVSVEEAFAWHERPGALQRMLPPWEKVQILEQSNCIENGCKVSTKIQVFSLPLEFSLLHQSYIKNEQFEDIQTKGPFSSYKHTHTFQKIDEHKSKIIDKIEYKLPFYLNLAPFNSSFIEEKFSKMFTYRHRTLMNDLYLHSLYSKQKLKILVTGGSGFVGKNLIPFLTTGGHSVVTLARNSRDSFSSAACVIWDKEKKQFKNPEFLENIDAVIHLAGENIAAKKWGKDRKKELIESRVEFTKSLCNELLKLKNPPRTFISASGIGIFGNRTINEVLTENSAIGKGFLAKLAQDWENASSDLEKAGIRTIHLRFGAIVSSAGGVLQKLLKPYKLFLGGPIGSGKQMLPWISMVDVLGLILFSLANDKVTGPMNAVSPNTVTNEQFSEILAQALSRPNTLRVPEMMIELIFGEMGKEILLYGQNATPQKATQLGFHFIHSHLHDALTYYLGY